jgi:hypothetical protein
MEAFDYFEELSACQHLFLGAASEPRANSLKIEVIEGRVSRVAVPVEVAGQSLGQGFPMSVDETCARYELTWNSYVLYQVTNELFGQKEESQDGILGNSASIYRFSGLLEYVVRSTIASDEYPGKLAHYQIICADHVIDVISAERPECLRISRTLQVN